MTQIASELDRLRSAIDALDAQILELVEHRLEAARAIAAAKEVRDPHLLKLCPRREADVIARLEERRTTCSSTAIRHIWRELMGHSLEMQAPLQLVIAASDEALHAPARGAFGSAPKLVRAPSAEAALRLAEDRHAVAILRHPLPVLPDTLRVFRAIYDEEGNSIAAAVGRVLPSETAAGGAEKKETWSPASWRSRKASQMPIYADAGAVSTVEARLAGAAPIVAVSGAAELRRALARAAEGKAFLLQAGDCAESFEAFSAEQVRTNSALLARMGRLLPAEIVHVARAAGQFAKPRSASIEPSEDGPIPTYRGDAVNGAERNRLARAPDPQRLLHAHRQSAATASLLDAFASADALGGGGRVFASHEALLLNYEQALTRQDEEGRWWATSGHMVWIGDRTRDLEGAHVEYASGIANSIGLKCGPGLDPDELLRLIDRLDPGNEAGRLVLIGRFGANEIDGKLPPLMRATRREGRKVLWVIDPMHGNSRTVSGYKTRLIGDIEHEIRHFFDIAATEGLHPGGIHLETTARPVAECMDVPEAARLGAAYETLCDPRLNPKQSIRIAELVAGCMGEQTAKRTRAA